MYERPGYSMPYSLALSTVPSKIKMLDKQYEIQLTCTFHLHLAGASELQKQCKEIRDDEIFPNKTEIHLHIESIFLDDKLPH